MCGLTFELTRPERLAALPDGPTLISGLSGKAASRGGSRVERGVRPQLRPRYALGLSNPATSLAVAVAGLAHVNLLAKRTSSRGVALHACTVLGGLIESHPELIFDRVRLPLEPVSVILTASASRKGLRVLAGE